MESGFSSQRVKEVYPFQLIKCKALAWLEILLTIIVHSMAVCNAAHICICNGVITAQITSDFHACN